MTALLFLSIWLAAVAAFLGSRAVTAPRQVRRKLAHVERYGLAARGSAGPIGAAPAEAPSLDLSKRIGHVGAQVAPRLKPGFVERLRRDLLAAGSYDTSAETVIGASALLGCGAVVLSALMVSSSGTSLGLALLLVGFAGYVGVALPVVAVTRRARDRREAIDREMPELVDLLVVAIEAGLGLYAALDRATSRMTGPLGDELRLVIQEQGLGASTPDTLGRLAERCDTSGVRTFARTLIHGEKLGISIGQSLRAVAVEMRKQRQAAAEERAHKMPVKILIPLALCIFPAMFVVLLAPAAMRIFDGL